MTRWPRRSFLWRVILHSFVDLQFPLLAELKHFTSVIPWRSRESGCWAQRAGLQRCPASPPGSSVTGPSLRVLSLNLLPQMVPDPIPEHVGQARSVPVLQLALTFHVPVSADIPRMGIGPGRPVSAFAQRQRGKVACLPSRVGGPPDSASL